MKNIEFPNDRKNELIEGIKDFFLCERDDEISSLEASLVLDYFVKEIGAEIYNQALGDSATWFRGKMENLESDYYMLEKR